MTPLIMLPGLVGNFLIEIGHLMSVCSSRSFLSWCIFNAFQVYY